jgi:hypothetical protein
VAILDYERPRADVIRFPWVVAAGVVPFMVELFSIGHEATRGDPPTSLLMFKLYHYAAGLAVALGWAWPFRIARRKFRLAGWLSASVCATLWVAWVCFLAFAHLSDLRARPAGKYYWAGW